MLAHTADMEHLSEVVFLSTYKSSVHQLVANFVCLLFGTGRVALSWFIRAKQWAERR